MFIKDYSKCTFSRQHIQLMESCDMLTAMCDLVLLIFTKTIHKNKKTHTKLVGTYKQICKVSMLTLKTFALKLKC